MIRIFELLEHPLSGVEQYMGIASLPFSHYINIPRDGNCLYSSFAMSMHPSICANGMGNKSNLFIKAGVSEAVYESYEESLEEFLEQKPTSVESLRREELDLFVGYLRLVVSSHLKVHSEEYNGYIEQGIEEYTRKNVDRMGERAGDLEIAVLSKEFECKITVYTPDSTGYKKIEYGSSFESFSNIMHTPDHFEPILNLCKQTV